MIILEMVLAAKKEKKLAGCQCLMPIITPMRETEFCRIRVTDRPGKKVCQALISTEESWVRWHAQVIPAIAGNIK
jgi:hypothetical protein